MKPALKLIINHTRGPTTVGAIAASQHRAGREPSHLTVSRPYGRPSHIAVTNTHFFTVRSHKPPVPRGHRQWIGDKR